MDTQYIQTSYISIYTYMCGTCLVKRLTGKLPADNKAEILARIAEGMSSLCSFVSFQIQFILT